MRKITMMVLVTLKQGNVKKLSLERERGRKDSFENPRFGTGVDTNHEHDSIRSIKGQPRRDPLDE